MKLKTGERCFHLDKPFNAPRYQKGISRMEFADLMLASLSDEGLVFKGGEYLRRFHGLKRAASNFPSFDFDFSAPNGIIEGIDNRVAKRFGASEIILQSKIIYDEADGHSFLLTGLGNGQHARVDIAYDKVLAQPLRLEARLHYGNSIRVHGVSLVEQAMEKLVCLVSKTKPSMKHLADLYFLIDEKNVGFDKELLLQEFEIHRQSVDSLVKTIAKAMYNMWSFDLHNLGVEAVDFTVMVQKIKNWLSGI